MRLQDLSRFDLNLRIRNFGGGPTRAASVFSDVYRKRAMSWDGVTSVRKDLRLRLSQSIEWASLTPRLFPSADGSIKLLFGNEDERFEAVYIPQTDRVTVCVSSQIGCSLDCAFCVTGLLPFRRNLATWEIVEQVMAAQRQFPNRPITNVVFMGMGEPLLNFDAVKKSVEILSDHKGLAIPLSKITLSTAGILPNILRWGREVGTSLAISVTGSDDEQRSKWMPINRRYPFRELVQTISQYIQETNKRVFCEYVVIAGETDRDQDVENLVGWFSTMKVTVNLIPYNENTSIPLLRPSEEHLEKFRRRLLGQGVFATVRWSYGSDVSAACGQLAGGI